MIVCVVGCCPGCENCCGIGIGCHQEPCRCGLPCACRWAEEETDPSHWRDGCSRHDDSDDTRRWSARDGWPSDSLDDALLYGEPCPVCGELGACAYDDEGRPLIHPVADDEEDDL